MSDYSRNASIESPSSPSLDLPLPIPLPQVSIDVDPELEYHVSTPSPATPPTLAESIPPGRTHLPPVHPRHPTGLRHRRKRRQPPGGRPDHGPHPLPTHPGLQGHHRTPAGRHCPPAGANRRNPCHPSNRPRDPNGFLPNNGRLPAFYIPHLGHRAVARFIRRSAQPTPTTTEGPMGGTGAEVYAYPLEAHPPSDASGDGGENRTGRAPPRVAPGPPAGVRDHLPPCAPWPARAQGTGASPLTSPVLRSHSGRERQMLLCRYLRI